MAEEWQVMNKVRSKIRKVMREAGIENVVNEDSFCTWDRDTQQVVFNYKQGGSPTIHCIYDRDGNLIKKHIDR